MRIFKYLTLSCVMLFLCVKTGYSQNSQKENIQTIKRFYTAYGSIKRISQNISKLDALQKIYLTKAFQAEIKKELMANGLDHDLITTDYGIDTEALKTLAVSSTQQPNIYVVSYTIDTVSASNQPFKQKVSLKLRLVNESGTFKIASVK